ncbi:hypothetical protein BAE44_0020937 [Dichanthelium oligosanthes]|uniref:KIB1-4 beta-propeller domain-containing protein n=1 Tax=Dichanthelium oligosanthes TaxID=888268 RepID=A0A1E5UZ30_9POAL|nr:hypothetical protein BAE44_0020937 [Dichanthelium oligosanthes]
MSWDRIRDHYVHSEFRNLHNLDKAYKLSLPLRRSLCCFGASHGWLIGTDDLSNPVLYNPFTSALIPLPPIIASECKTARSLGRDCHSTQRQCYPPLRGGDSIAVIIHGDGNQMSFARPGESCWRLATTMTTRRRSIFADCMYHSRRFFTVRMNGVVQAWDLRDPENVTKDLILGAWEIKMYRRVTQVVLFRFLVSILWGDLQHIRVINVLKCKDSKPFKVEIRRIDIERCRLEVLCARTALRDHVVFVGQNRSACLPADKFPDLRPNCIYFTSPFVYTEIEPDLYGRPRGCRVVKVYDMKKRTLQDVFSCSGREYANKAEDGIWITPNL